MKPVPIFRDASRPPHADNDRTATLQLGYTLLEFAVKVGYFLSLVRDRLFPGGLGNVAQALAHRNYRIYAGGNAVSLIGIWMQRVAVGWLAWTLTHSGTWLGVMSMAEFFPVVFL